MMFFTAGSIVSILVLVIISLLFKSLILVPVPFMSSIMLSNPVLLTEDSTIALNRSFIA